VNKIRERLVRSEEQLRSTVSLLCHYIWDKQLRPGEHLWSIPADPSRDFDFILSDAIAELVELRTRNASAEAARELWGLGKFDIRHGKGCPWRNDNDGVPCSCGLDAFEKAIAGREATKVTT